MTLDFTEDVLRRVGLNLSHISKSHTMTFMADQTGCLTIPRLPSTNTRAILGRQFGLHIPRERHWRYLITAIWSDDNLSDGGNLHLKLNVNDMTIDHIENGLFLSLPDEILQNRACVLCEEPGMRFHIKYVELTPEGYHQ